MVWNTTTESGAQAHPTRRTVDAFTRTLHALLALSFSGAYITADSDVFKLLHISLGYTMGGLLLARMLWGLLGPRQARLSALWGKLRGLGDELHGLATGQVNWRQIQNLSMAWTIAVVLLAIASVVLSGYVTEQEWTGEWMQELHEFLPNCLLTAVLAHVTGVVVLSFLRGRNLAAPMLTGRVPGKGPDLIQSNHGVLAILLGLAVLSFGVWQWEQSPAAQMGSADMHSWLAEIRSAASDDND